MVYVLLISATLFVASVVTGRRARAVTAEQRAVALSRHVQPYLHAVQTHDATAQDHLVRADHRTWVLIEPTLLTTLPHLPYDARLALIALLRERGAVARALRRSRLGGEGRVRAAETLGTLAPETCARELVRLLASPDPEVRRAAISGLGHSGDPAAANALVAGLGRRRGLEPALVLHNLVRLGDVALPGVLWGLDDRKPGVRAVCADALGLIGAQHATGALTLVLDEDPDPDVRVRAARALTRLGSPAIRTAIGEAPAPTPRRGRARLPVARHAVDQPLEMHTARSAEQQGV
jgi:hypothetical protein